jgi:hypothetical protein
MIGGENHERLLGPPGLVERGEHAAGRGIHVLDGHLEALQLGCSFGSGREITRDVHSF